MSARKLKDRIALVTGASRGIGRSAALAFADEGADVAIASSARSAADLEAVKALILGKGVRCATIVADLAQPDAADTIFKGFHGHFEHLDILVNNAGIGSSLDPRPLIHFDRNVWDLTFLINVTAPFLLCQKFVPEMMARRYGRIINVTSTAARGGLLDACAYSASKHALVGLTASLAAEVVKHGITVNGISPGPVRSLMQDKRVAYDAARTGKSPEELVAGMTPVGRRLEPEEVAPVMIFLAGEESWVVTGQNFVVTAGSVLLG